MTAPQRVQDEEEEEEQSGLHLYRTLHPRPRSQNIDRLLCNGYASQINRRPLKGSPIVWYSCCFINRPTPKGVTKRVVLIESILK